MQEDELTISDVLKDNTKNFCNIYSESLDEEDEGLPFKDSLYHTETEFVNLIRTNEISNGKYLTLISLNIANLFSKLNFFKIFMENIKTQENKPDIIIVTETHINHNNRAGYDGNELANILQGYRFFHAGRRVKKGGGVGIFVENSLANNVQVCAEYKFIEEQFENVIIKIPDIIASDRSTLKMDLIIAGVYRQPNSENMETFLKNMEIFLKAVDKKKQDIIIAGDMNLDILKYENHLLTANYLDLLTAHKMLPRIVRPTHIKKQSATLIDHIFTRNNNNTVLSGIIDTEIAGSGGYTDHLPTFTILKAKLKDRPKTEPITKCFFTTEGNHKRREGLRNENWKELYNENDPNKIYDLLQEKYGKHYAASITTKTFKPNSNRVKREPWMSSDILADMRKRDRLAKDKDRREEYKSLRNDIVKRVRNAEKDHLQKQIEESMGDIKQHWKILKRTTNKLNNMEEATTSFYYSSLWIEDKQENAENMNAYLAQVGPKTNENVGQSKFGPDYYLHKHREANTNSILLNNITEDEVVDVCKKLAPKTSVDPFGFQQKIVLGDSDIMAPIIAHLVNCSQRTGICPENSKMARVIPIYKGKGNKHLYENYRPISLLPVFSKIMERLIYDKVFDFLVRYEILFDSQYGFRNGHNTSHATLDFLKTIEESFERNEYAIGVFCDLSKAFDTLNHGVLIKKLWHYGIRGKANEWFQSYLTNRSQYVDWNGCKSSRAPLMTGVPQGSILGPLLFLICINDLPAAASKLKCIIFADDSNLLIKGNNLEELQTCLNSELEGISNFFKANGLKLNANKTKVICFRKKSLQVDYESTEIYLDGVKLKFEEEASFLGITIDSHLTWESHCNKVANKISRNSSTICRVKRMLPSSSLRLLYNSLIQPHIQYGLAAWGGCSNQNKKRITAIQKRITRTISKSHFKSHTEPRMKALGILNLEHLYEQQCLTLIHDVIYNNAPRPIKKLVDLQNDKNEYSLRHNKEKPLDLKKPNPKTKVGLSSFSYKAPNYWNKLPNNIREI